MTPVLQTTCLSKSFGSVVAAHDLNVTVSRGERIGLIGTNGAGKTTFVNMVTGYVRPDSGRIILEGGDITGRSPRLIARSGVCRSFQVPQLFLTLTPRDNLIAAIGIANGAAFSPTARSDTPGVRHALDELLDRFRLQEFRDRLCSELPSGVRKLLDIAVAVTRAPKLLLLDEPTSGVATGQKFPLMDIVMDALGDDVTVLFVEHDMDIVSRYARRVLAFYEGQIIADGVPAHVLTDARVRNHVTGAIC